MRRAFKLFRGFSDTFSAEVVVALVAIYGLLKGTVYNVWLTNALPYFKSIGVSGAVYQSLFTFASLPWSLKAALGAVVDIVPLFGYHKTSYILLVSVGGTLAYLFLGLVPFSAAAAAMPAALGFVAMLQIAFADLLAEGKCAELMRAHPHTGADLMSLALSANYAGTFAGSLASGPVADLTHNPRMVFLLAAPVAALAVAPVALGWFPDTRLPPARRRVRTDRLRRHRRLVALSAALTAAAAVTGYAAIAALPGATQAALFVVNAVLLNALSLALLPRVMARAALYLFLVGFMQLNISGASDYWFTAGPECVAGGPHFSYTFFNSVGAVMASAAGAAAVALFQRYGRAARFRVAFAVAGALKVVGALSDVVIFSRTNVRMGVPDGAAFLVGDAVMQILVQQLEFLPGMVLIAKVCPAGVEATVFAILASFMNLGRTGARVAGLGLIDLAGIRTTVPCDFRNLPLVVLAGRVLLPMCALPLIPVLIPEARMTDEIVGDDGRVMQRDPIV